MRLHAAGWSTFLTDAQALQFYTQAHTGEHSRQDVYPKSFAEFGCGANIWGAGVFYQAFFDLSSDAGLDAAQTRYYNRLFVSHGAQL